jgi:hypothetical protein
MGGLSQYYKRVQIKWNVARRRERGEGEEKRIG